MSDTRHDLARDQYYCDHAGECGTCQHEYKQQGVYYCGIMGDRTDEVAQCTEWEERRVKL